MCENMVFSMPKKIRKTSVGTLILQWNDGQCVYIKCTKTEVLPKTLSYIARHVCDGRVTTPNV